MKLSDMKTLDQVIEDQRVMPEFREEWDRMSFARSVANRVVQYRTTHSLSQRDLAAAVGLVQPQVARLERAEHQPSFETLAKLSRATGLDFNFEITHGFVELVSGAR